MKDNLFKKLISDRLTPDFVQYFLKIVNKLFQSEPIKSSLIKIRWTILNNKIIPRRYVREETKKYKYQMLSMFGNWRIAMVAITDKIKKMINFFISQV
jgi:hypothetical protein